MAIEQEIPVKPPVRVAVRREILACPVLALIASTVDRAYRKAIVQIYPQLESEFAGAEIRRQVCLVTVVVISRAAVVHKKLDGSRNGPRWAAPLQAGEAEREKYWSDSKHRRFSHGGVSVILAS